MGVNIAGSPACRTLGPILGASTLYLVFASFEDHRETLLDSGGARWLLLMPETTERMRQAAGEALRKMKQGGTEMTVQATSRFIGGRLGRRAANAVTAMMRMR